MAQQRKTKLFHLNLFDTIVLTVVVILAGVVVWFQLGDVSFGRSTPQMLTYTVLMNNVREGTGDYVHVGDTVFDVIKNYDLGVIRSVDVQKATEFQLDEENRIYRVASIEGKEDIYVVLEAPATQEEDQFTVAGGQPIRVGQHVFMYGKGYMASGMVVGIQRMDDGGEAS